MYVSQNKYLVQSEKEKQIKTLWMVTTTNNGYMKRYYSFMKSKQNDLHIPRYFSAAKKYTTIIIHINYYGFLLFFNLASLTSLVGH